MLSSRKLLKFHNVNLKCHVGTFLQFTTLNSFLTELVCLSGKTSISINNSYRIQDDFIRNG